jgi:hypothetical protein
MLKTCQRALAGTQAAGQLHGRLAAGRPTGPRLAGAGESILNVKWRMRKGTYSGSGLYIFNSTFSIFHFPRRGSSRGAREEES